MAKIGWIGLGNMGMPMCLNLIKTGNEVIVNDISKDIAGKALEAGATWAESSKAVAEAADYIFTSLPTGKILQAVVLGENGVLEGVREGSVFVDMSTVSVEESMYVAEKLAEKGCKMMRAPVTGSTLLAEAGKLGVLASGDKETYNEILPLFEAIGEKQFYLGEAEEARVMKLAINTMIATSMQMEAEAVVLCEKAGLDIKQVTEIIAGSAVGSPVCNYKAQTIAEGTYEPAFSVKLMMKDLDLALDVAKQYGVPMLSTSLTRQQLQAAAATGNAEKDFAVLTKVLEDACGYKR